MLNGDREEGKCKGETGWPDTRAEDLYKARDVARLVALLDHRSIRSGLCRHPPSQCIGSRIFMVINPVACRRGGAHQLIGCDSVLACFGTIGGALFGFDISSMSAWIGAPQYLKYFDSPDSNLQGGVRFSLIPCQYIPGLTVGRSRRPCRPVPLSAPSPPGLYVIMSVVAWCSSSPVVYGLSVRSCN